MSYKRIADGVTVKWNKENETAKKIVKEITGSEDYPVKVDNETAQEIREKYNKEIQANEEKNE